MYVPSRGSNKGTEAGDRKEPARTERKKIMSQEHLQEVHQQKMMLENEAEARLHRALSACLSLSAKGGEK